MSALLTELHQLEGVQRQDPESGAAASGEFYAEHLSNRLFGAPYQLLESVDARFSDVNENVGNEYLRNFLLNSPILHIRPGIPTATGGKTWLSYIADAVNATETIDTLSLIWSLMWKFITDAKPERRLFGFRAQYKEYMEYVNYMCRAAAMLMNLTHTENYPNGTFCHNNGEFVPFEVFNWENYRMIDSTNIKTYKELLNETGIWTAAVNVLGKLLGNAAEQIGRIVTDKTDQLSREANYAVQFMVEPLTVTETITNTVSDSMIAGAIEGVTESIGSEVAFLKNSNINMGIIDKAVAAAAQAGHGAMDAIIGVAGATGLTGGYVTTLLEGVKDALVGQKMIYPKIFKKNDINRGYEFTINLYSPYGDAYNYYMNIIVPLMHLLALASPRLITGNGIQAPFIVQAFIPGMCTCQMGIINNMTIIKNPEMNHVSVDGFPLSLQVKLSIEELYSNLPISPWTSPASFLTNESLNEYLANAAGLIPSYDTYLKELNVGVLINNQLSADWKEQKVYKKLWQSIAGSGPQQ